MGVDPWGFDLERQALARRLRNRRLVLRGIQTAVLLAFLIALLTGGSVALRTWVLALGLPGWVSIAVFVSAVVGLGALLGFPLAYLGDYRSEKGFGLTDRSFGSWLRDYGKSFGLSLGSAVVVAEVVLWLLRVTPEYWWAIAWGLGVLFSFVISFLAPILLVPMFFRLRPIRDPTLRSRFESLATAAGTPIVGIFELKASTKTRRSNAAVMGFGRTRRIVVTDTLLQAYAPEEIDNILAHELGHQRFRDPWIGSLVGAFVSLLVAAATAAAYAASYSSFGIAAPYDMAGLPLLAFYAALLTAAVGPPELAWSRARERRADAFALGLTRQPAAFRSAMIKLHDRNLGVADPRPWEVWLFYSHPSGRERVEFTRSHAQP